MYPWPNFNVEDILRLCRTVIVRIT